MKEELNRIISAYQNYYGLTRLQAIKCIKQDLTELTRLLKPVKLKRGTK